MVGALDFKSVYTPRDEYGAARRELLKGIQDDFIRQAEAAGTSKAAAREAIRSATIPVDVSGPTKRAWTAYQGRLGHLADAEAKFKGLAESGRGFVVPSEGAASSIATLCKLALGSRSVCSP